jgi:hypothetical protein
MQLAPNQHDYRLFLRHLQQLREPFGHSSN